MKKLFFGIIIIFIFGGGGYLYYSNTSTPTVVDEITVPESQIPDADLGATTNRGRVVVENKFEKKDYIEHDSESLIDSEVWTSEEVIDTVEEKPLVEMNYEGLHSASFSRTSNQNYSEQGVTITVHEITTGTIIIIFTEDGSATCTTNMSTAFVGTFNSGSGTINSIRCNGSINNQDGAFTLNGMLTGAITIGGKTASSEGPFTVSGHVTNNKINGDILVEGTTPIDFTE